MDFHNQAVIVILFNANKDKILLTKRRDVPIWVLPGGGIEKDETPEFAVVREAFEETHLKVSITRQIGRYLPINRLAKITHVFECKLESGSPSLTAETCDIAFFSIEEAKKILFIIHREWLEDALSSTPKPIGRDMTSVNYWALCRYFFCHPLQVLRFALSRLGFPLNKR